MARRSRPMSCGTFSAEVLPALSSRIRRCQSPLTRFFPLPLLLPFLPPLLSHHPLRSALSCRFPSVPRLLILSLHPFPFTDVTFLLLPSFPRISSIPLQSAPLPFLPFTSSSPPALVSILFLPCRCCAAALWRASFAPSLKETPTPSRPPAAPWRSLLDPARLSRPQSPRWSGPSCPAGGPVSSGPEQPAQSPASPVGAQWPSQPWHSPAPSQPSFPRLSPPRAVMQRGPGTLVL